MSGRELALLDAFLSAQPARGVNLRNFSRRYGLDRLVRTGESLLARGTSDHAWTYLLPSDTKGGSALLEALEGSDRHLVGFDDWLLDMVRARFRVEKTLYCKKLLWPLALPPPEPVHPIRRLNSGDAAFIQENSDYGEYTDVRYIEDQIEHGIGGGIERPEGGLAAWALTHDDRAIGFLHVSEPCRRRGYAESLARWMVGEVLSSGGIPFIHVEPTNERSLSLAKKTGFVEDGVCWWVILDR